MARDQVALAAASVAEVMRGRLVAGDGAQEFDGVSIDSRTTRAGQLFIGIRGGRFEGAEYAPGAVDAGAAGVVVPRDTEATTVLAADPRQPVVIEVDDTTAALQMLGRHVRRASRARVTAITGSAGKTTTKEAAAELLAARFTVFRNEGNLNNHIGLPLSLVELRSRPEMAVVELGMNHAGEIRQLVSLAEPEMRVWTNVGDAHLGFFDSPDAIADAKAEILEGAGADHVLVANADDQRVMARARQFRGRLVTFGVHDTADVRATDVVDRGLDGTSADLRTPAGRARVNVPLPGAGNLLNVLAATAVAVTWGVPLEAAAERIARLKPARRRGEVVRLGRGLTLVDDSYNSSPAALRGALQTIALETRCGRRVALLGEMLELGAHADGLHEECGRAVARSGVSVLVTVGGEPAERMAEAARLAGMRGGIVRHVPTADDAVAAVSGLLKAGDLVLVKGSRGVRMDVVADAIRDEWR